MDLGQQIREARKAAGLSQTKLAQMADLSQCAVSEIETGIRKNPRWNTVQRLLAACAAALVALAIPAAGISKTNGMPTSIGKGEGQLNLVAWEGYTEKQWVAPFEKQTGCKVTAKYAGDSNYATTTSAAITQTVLRATVTPSLTSSV